MHHRSIHFALIALFVLLVLAASLAIGVGGANAVGFAPHADFAIGSSPISVAVGDFNGDGKLDLVTANAGAYTVSVLLGDGSGGFAPHADFAIGSSPISVAVGDFNGDGKLDLVTANPGANTVSVLLGNGSGGFGAKTDFTTGTNPRSVAVGDFNGDGKQDLVTANYDASTASVLLSNGSGGFAAKTDFTTGTNPNSVAVGDFNSDGKADLVTANPGANTVSVLLGNGSGGFGAKTDFADGGFAGSVAVGDFNGDGKQDLVTVNSSPWTVSVLLGNGSGGFGAKTDFATDVTDIGIAVGDLDGDGKQDLATAINNYGALNVLLGNGSGGFDPKINIALGDDPWGVGPTSIAVGDFNGDGKKDLATANYKANSAGVLLNESLFSGTMTIEAAATRNGLVRIDSAVPDAAELRLRDHGGIWSAWQPYVAQVYWALPFGDGAKTVEAQYRNSDDPASWVRADSILLDTTAPTTTDDASANWQTESPVTVTLTPDDGAGSGMSGGLATTQYKVDGATGWTNGTSFKIGADGTHTIVYRSTDAVGNVEDAHSCTVKIDTTPPTTTVRGVTGIWQAWPQTVFLTAADAGAGMSGGKARIEYDLDETGWVTGDWVVVSTDGDHTLQVRAVDAVGNEEEVQRMEVLIDRSAPLTTDNANPGGLATWHAGPWTLTLSPTDPRAADGSHSGMAGGQAKTEYSTDGGATWVSATHLDCTRWRRGGGSGVFSVLYRSTDAAGNRETTQTATVRIDNSLPTATDDAPAGPQSAPVSVHISGEDALSGVASIGYSLDGAAWTEAAYPGGAGLAVVVTGVGKHTLRYYAIDAAGNHEAGYRVCTVTITGGGLSAPRTGRRLFLRR